MDPFFPTVGLIALLSAWLFILIIRRKRRERRQRLERSLIVSQEFPRMLGAPEPKIFTEIRQEMDASQKRYESWKAEEERKQAIRQAEAEKEQRLRAVMPLPLLKRKGKP